MRNRTVPDPSDMTLHPGNVQGYNNEIKIAGLDAAIGYKPGINEAEPINPASRCNRAFQRKPASPGPFTRGHSLRSSSGTRQMTMVRRLVSPEHRRTISPELLVSRRNGRAMGRRRPTKKKKRRPSWPLGE